MLLYRSEHIYGLKRQTICSKSSCYHTIMNIQYAEWINKFIISVNHYGTVR
jgi:hypothetical protein